MTESTLAVIVAREGARIRPRALLLALAGVGFVLLWGLPTIVIPLATDQVMYLQGGRIVLDGGQLYRDFWEIKPPLIYLIYAIPGALVGDHMEAIRVLDLLNTALATGAVFLLSRRLFNERSALFAAGFYAFAYLTWARYDGLAESESFIAAPLALALFLYPAQDRARWGEVRALGAGLLLGAAFWMKTAVVLFTLALPIAELLLRTQRTWSARGALSRLALAGIGFLAVGGVMAGYMIGGGVLDDFLDIQRHYTAPYNAYRWDGAEGSHLRFVLRGTSDWIKDAPFLVVPAAVALFFGLRRPEHERGVLFLAVLAGLGVLAVWWQGKMFHYHWLLLIPLLASLAGYTVDRVLSVFEGATRPRRWGAWALLAAGLIALAFSPLVDTYDSYRNLVRFADGSLSRREVEARYNPLLMQNHEIVDYVRTHGTTDDQLYIWGLWPVANFWLDRPFVSRFVFNHGLRATWTPASWREELMEDLEANPPRFLAVARGDNQPWLVGTSQTSDEHLRDSFPELRRFVEAQYQPVLDNGLFLLYERMPSAAGEAR